jgi:N-acetylglutamate synthase/N-acetylornithine aminotransferase
VVPFAEGDEKDFEAALLDVCTQLAEDIVRNGEGYVLAQWFLPPPPSLTAH